MDVARLKQAIESANSCNTSDGPFKIALTAAFIKSLSFQGEIWSARENGTSFWLAPALRSICEDLIVLGFIEAQLEQHADETIKLLMELDFSNAINAQQLFFEKYRPFQPFIKSSRPKNTTKKIKSRLKEINLSFVAESDSFTPSVRQMAKAQDLLLLYDYLYNATSRLVHFSPGTLLRMAWGDLHGNLEFNPNSFENYYADFLDFYGTHLLCAFSARFSTKLNISIELKQFLDERLEVVNKFHRWPELITFEELNAVNPWNSPDTIQKSKFWNFLLENPGIVFIPK